MKNNKKGFTLVELIVVIAIIGILAAVLIPAVSGYIEKAQYSSDVQDAANMTKLVNTKAAEKGLKELTAVEVKTLILTDGQYDLVPKKNQWTFVYNKESKAVEVIKFSDVKLTNSGDFVYLDTTNSNSIDITEPEEIFLPGYYLIGKGKTKVEQVVNLIRNFKGEYKTTTETLKGEAAFSEIVKLLPDNIKNQYEGLLRDKFSPTTTLFINENGTYTEASDRYATNADADTKIDGYVKLTVKLTNSIYNSELTISELKIFTKVTDTWQAYTPTQGQGLGLFIKSDTSDTGFEEFNPDDDETYSPDLDLFADINGDKVNAYLGVISPEMKNVIFGDSIAYVPAFSDKVKLPDEIKVPATIEFISEGAFINVMSETKLAFSGPVVFESGFKYNEFMSKVQPQPVTKQIDFEKLGIYLFKIIVRNNGIEDSYDNDSYLERKLGDEIDIDLEGFRTTNKVNVDGIDVRFGFNDNLVFKDGKAYYGRFTAKLFENGKLVGYCNIYYRDYIELDQN